MHILLNIFFPQKKESHGLDLEDLTDTEGDPIVYYIAALQKNLSCLHQSRS